MPPYNFYYMHKPLTLLIDEHLEFSGFLLNIEEAAAMTIHQQI